MNQGEGRALLEAAGTGLSDPEMTELVGRAERWPVGLYLAALAHKAGGQPGNAGFAFTGDDRFLAEYLHAELLTHLPARRQHRGELPGDAACPSVLRWRRPDVGRRPGGLGRAEPGKLLAGDGRAAGGSR